MKFLILVVFVLTLQIGCMESPYQPSSGQGIVPHPPGWVNASSHGVAYLADASSCATSCHGTDYSGGFTGISCYSCHSFFPHLASWKDTPQLHGDASRQSRALAQCSACHGGDFKGGISGVSCFKCHSTYPHETGWGQPSAHGKTALSLGVTASCGTSCHGTDFRGGLVNVSCFTCHADFPHAAGWVDYTSHGAAAKPSNSQSCATLCHGTDFGGGDSKVSCYACHARYPHTATIWNPFTTHYAWVLANGDPSCITAQGCHISFRGPVFNPPPSCTNFCHRALSGR